MYKNAGRFSQKSTRSASLIERGAAIIKTSIFGKLSVIPDLTPRQQRPGQLVRRAVVQARSDPIARAERIRNFLRARAEKRAEKKAVRRAKK
jgi:hypothetical protein